LQATHVSIGHGGHDRMIKELGNKYKNITRNNIETFLHFCEPCQQKQKGSKKAVVVKPIISSDFNSRCQVDLIDFQSHPDGKFKFIMVYQDHLTKFVSDFRFVSKLFLRQTKVRKQLTEKVDDFDKYGIRRKVHQFWHDRDTHTLDKILVPVNEDNGLPNFSRTSLFRLLKSMDFVYMKRGRNSGLIEKSEIILWL